MEMLHEHVCHARTGPERAPETRKMIQAHLQKRLCQRSERTSLFFLRLKRIPRFALQSPSSPGQKQDPVGAGIGSNLQETDLIEAEFQTRAGRDAVYAELE
jgi:hypothetical protein